MAVLSRGRPKKWILLKIIKKSTDLAHEMAEKIAKFYVTFFPSPPVIFLCDPARPVRPENNP